MTEDDQRAPSVEAAAAADAEGHHDFHGQFQLMRKLGEGGFGRVYLARRNRDSVKVAVKIFFRKFINCKMILNEVNCLKTLNHPHIVQFVDSFVDDTNIFVVMEKINGGELFYRVGHGRAHSEKYTRDIIWTLLTAVNHCHDHDIIHRDIKPENIIMKSYKNDGNIKLVDFGLSIQSKTELSGSVGTAMYRAPEMCKGLKHHKPIDIWAVGVVFFILVSGHPPFEGGNFDELNNNIISGEYDFDGNPDAWANMSIEGKDFLSRLLCVDPKTRITAKEAFLHEWMSVKWTPGENDDLSLSLPKLRDFNKRRKSMNALKLVFYAKKWRECAKTHSLSTSRANSPTNSGRKKFDDSPPNSPSINALGKRFGDKSQTIIGPPEKVLSREAISRLRSQTGEGKEEEREREGREMSDAISTMSISPKISPKISPRDSEDPTAMKEEPAQPTVVSPRTWSPPRSRFGSPTRFAPSTPKSIMRDPSKSTQREVNRKSPLRSRPERISFKNIDANVLKMTDVYTKACHCCLALHTVIKEKDGKERNKQAPLVAPWNVSDTCQEIGARKSECESDGDEFEDDGYREMDCEDDEAEPATKKKARVSSKRVG
jgi:serine/threonine protein kinase